jgi:L-2-hydroxyglutarate oxidase LhgO
MTAFDFDAVVVGAGAVGLACGYALAQRGSSVVVVEREPLIGAGVSSRNSEVIHAGLYYPTGSLKARLCVQGRLALYHFLEAHGVPYDRCGKLVVATEPDEGPRLDAIASQAEINGVEGVRRLSGAAARALEPQLRVVEALLSPDSGVFDSHGYMLALQGEIEDRGGSVVTGAPFERAEPLPGGGFDVQVGGADPTRVRTRLLVIAAGLGAQACAAAVEGFPDAQIPSLHFGKGSYFSLAGPWGCTTAATSGGAPVWALICSSSKPRTTRSIPPARASSTPMSAGSGPGCPTARSAPTTPASGPSCMGKAKPSRTSAS